MNRTLPLCTFLLFVLLSFLFTRVQAQTKQIQKGTVQHIKVHGKGLEGNLDGDPADRSVCVYLPASYKSNPGRRYPVIYFLHGYTDNDIKF